VEFLSSLPFVVRGNVRSGYMAGSNLDCSVLFRALPHLVHESAWAGKFEVSAHIPVIAYAGTAVKISLPVWSTGERHYTFIHL
jgi:hypothetical protein